MTVQDELRHVNADLDGKVDELAWGAAISYTDDGRMLGHVVLGERRVAEAVASAGGVAEEVALRLSHMLLSHHGELEWGSPRRPATARWP